MIHAGLRGTYVEVILAMNLKAQLPQEFWVVPLDHAFLPRESCSSLAPFESLLGICTA